MSRRCTRMPTKVAGLVGVLLAATLLSGCLSVPDSGPVRELPTASATPDRESFPLNPRPPRPGEQPADVISGFLDAMLATPLSTMVAREYLQSDYASTWDPSRRIITYAGRRPVEGTASATVDLTGANWLDDRGAWQGPLGGHDATLAFSLAREDGEWRITKAPDALIVPNQWFRTRFAQHTLYFFDPTGRFLVPEPIFTPTGSQLASSLVSSLLLGPSQRNRDVDRTFLPAVSDGVSVPVNDHTAHINITGSNGAQSAHAPQLMAAQLAWTLRQDPAVSRITLTIDGRPVRFPDSGATFSTSSGMQYDPNGFAAGTDLFAVRDGAVVSSSDGESFSGVSGAWSGTHPISAITVDPTENHAVAVTADRRGLLVGPLVGKGGVVTEAPISGHRLLRPAWDLAGRIWVVDQTRAGAEVSYRTLGGGAGRGFATIRVPGVTGENVRRFLVSRDGTRLVAVIRGPAADRVVVSRLAANAAGVVTSASPAVTVPYPAQGSVRIADIAWRSPTTVAAVRQLAGHAIINDLSLDGATDVLSSPPRSLVNVVSQLVGSPVAGTGLYVRSGRLLVDVTDSRHSGRITLPPGTRPLGYAG